MRREATSIELRGDRAYIVGKLSDAVTVLSFEVDVTDLVHDLLNKPWLKPNQETE